MVDRLRAEAEHLDADIGVHWRCGQRDNRKVLAEQSVDVDDI